MTPRLRFGLTAVAFALTWPGWSVIDEHWHPLRSVAWALRLFESARFCGATWLPRWVGGPIAFVAHAVPLAGAALSLAALAATSRRGHRVSVSPALALATAASAFVGAVGLFSLLDVLSSPFGALLLSLWLAACFAPALLLPVPLKRMRPALLAMTLACTGLFGVAAAVQWPGRG